MKRLVGRELMDDESEGTLADWRGSVADLAVVNARLGGTRALLRELDALPLPPYSILDVAAGAGDLARCVLDHLRDRGIRASCVALDRSERMLALAGERVGRRRDIELRKGDATKLPFDDSTFDLAIMNLALHHFEPPVAVQVLRELARVATTVIVDDLRRSRIAWAIAYFLFPLFTHNRLTRHDGPISVRRAYTTTEAEALAGLAGWRRVAVRKHFGYRMTIVGGR